MSKLKYKGYSIVFQEVPNEISLVINICGCPYKCKGCHSKYLWENDGTILDKKELINLLDKYSFAITCVCFMGGDWELEELKELQYVIRKYNLKTAIYSGSDRLETFISLKEFRFDYIKIGSYQESRGGLNVESTNQKMFMLIDNGYIDITDKFQRELT